MLSKLKGILFGADALLLLPVLLYFLFLLMVTPGTFHGGDSWLWRLWARYAAEHGITQIYHSHADYPPVYLYVLYVFEKFFGSHENVAQHLDRLKWITLVFDFLPVILMFFAGMREQMRRNLHWYLLFNFAYLYNTLAWGQVDAIHTNLCLLALLLGVRFPAAAMAVFVVAFNTKMQSIIFLPILGIMYWAYIKKPIVLLKILAAAVLTELVIVFPFILAGEWHSYLQVFTNSVDAYPVASMNAFNMWHLLLAGDPFTTQDQTKFMALSYKQWGLLLFFLCSTAILLPLFLRVKMWGISCLKQDRELSLLFLSAGLVSLAFFFFNTQMHERYSHPAMIFFFFYAVKSKHFIPYILVSIAYLLNMEAVLAIFNIQHTSFVYAPALIATLFLVTLAWALKHLVEDFPYGEIRTLKPSGSKTPQGVKKR